VAGAGGVCAQQDLDVFDVLGGDLLERRLGDGDLVGGGARARVAGPKLAGQRLARLVEVGEQRMKAEAALEVARCALLVGVRTDQRRVDVDRRLLGRPCELPSARPRVGVRGPQRSSPPSSRASWSITRNAVESEATAPNSGAWSRTARRSARQSPPSASITARSRTTRPGSWPERRSRSPASTLDSAWVKPVLPATCESSADPACETNPPPSAVTSTVKLRPSHCTFKVILLSSLFDSRQAEESLLSRTLRRPGYGRALAFVHDRG